MRFYGTSAEAGYRKRKSIMAEVQKMCASEVKCWQCGSAIYKGTKQCPKCGAPSPTADIPKLRKALPIFFFVGMPVGIAMIIIGLIMFKNMFTTLETLLDNIKFIEIPCLLIAIGLIGVMIGPLVRSFLAKVEKATREKQ